MPMDRVADSSLTLTRRQVFSQSWPIMLANAAAPMVGFIDTLVIGRFAGTAALAGIGLGAVIYAIFYWGFGFLRMSTAGLAAQSHGADDQSSVQAHLVRAVPLGLIIGVLIMITQTLLLTVAFQIYTASDTIETSAATYISARLWGLPATLGSIALMGWFVGVSRSGRALSMQIILNLINLVLSPLFVISFGWGLYGVGLASAAAEWGGFAAGLWLACQEIKTRGGWAEGIFSPKILCNLTALRKLGIANSNIFIRTLTLTFAFSFLGNAAANQGEIFLAGNHILMQFITLSALVLDAFAHTAEAMVGAAYGAKNHQRFDQAVRLTTEFSIIFSCLCSAFILLIGPFVISTLTTDPAVIESARTYLPFCALVPVFGFAAFQMDGIFIGTTQTRAMRDAGILAVLIYVASHYMLTYALGPQKQATSLWIAFLIYYIVRALTLTFYFPAIKRDLNRK